MLLQIPECFKIHTKIKLSNSRAAKELPDYCKLVLPSSRFRYFDFNGFAQKLPSMNYSPSFIAH